MGNLSGMEMNFEELYQQHYDNLYKAAYRITGNTDDAEDVVQDTFLNAYKGFDEFRHQSAFSTWIYRIMLNCSYKYIKKRDHLPIHDIAKRNGLTENAFWESIKSNESVEDTVQLEDLRETCIQLFLNCIPKQQKIAFSLKVLMEFSTKEVSNIMQISESAVKINVYRARQHMKENMEGRCSFINPSNPCSCSNWLKYAINTGSIKQIPHIKTINKRTHEEMSLIVNEMSFVDKLSKLFENQPEQPVYDDFIDNMRKIISGGSLKIFS